MGSWAAAIAISMVAGAFVAMVSPVGAGESRVRDARRISYDGRVILATGSPYECGDETYEAKFAIEVRQFESGSSKPAELAAFRSRWALAAVSDDARWAVTCGGELRDLDRTTSTSVLPVGYDVVPDAELERAAFSPDATRLAFSFGGTVYVYDIASDSLEESLTTPSAEYTIGTLHGEIGDVDWLDATTLVVWHFAGTMPSTIFRNDSGEYSLPEANTYSIVAPAGDRIASAVGSAAIEEVRGDTLLLSSQEWVDVSELRAGSATPRGLPSRSLRCISSDGTHAVQQGTPWRLVELRTGEETPLEARVKLRKPFLFEGGLRVSPPCVWSPDAQYVAALSSYQGSVYLYDKLFLVPTAAGVSGKVAYSLPLTPINHLGWTIP